MYILVSEPKKTYFGSPMCSCCFLLKSTLYFWQILWISSYMLQQVYYLVHYLVQYLVQYLVHITWYIGTLPDTLPGTLSGTLPGTLPSLVQVSDRLPTGGFTF